MSDAAEAPWLKYQKASPAPAEGPWTRYQSTSSQGAAGAGKDATGAPGGDNTPSMLGSLWAGLVHGTGNVLHGGARIGARMGQAPEIGQTEPSFSPERVQQVDQTAAKRESAYQASLGVKAHPIASGIGEVGGEVAGMAAEAGPLAAASPGTAPLRILWNGLLGVGGALSTPKGGEPMDPASQAKRGALGGVGGAVVGGAGEAIGRAIAPRLGGDAATLANKGVQLTPGQMVPGAIGPAVRGAESKLQSLPILGDFISGARQRSLTSYNTATINQALEPIGASLPSSMKAGNEAVKTAGNAISKAYNEVLDRIPKVVVDRDLQNALKAIELDARGRPAVWQNLSGELKRVTSKLKRGEFTGREAQLAASELERVARGLQGSEDFFKREVAKHLREARSSLFDAIERQHPEVAPDLQKTNAAWAMLTRIENAAGRRAGSNGIFTPMDLLAAVKSGAGGVRRREFARGDALFQEWAQAGQRLLPSMVPDSGTAGRLLIAELIGMGIDPMKTIMATGAATGAGLAYRGLGAAARSQPGPIQQGARAGVEALSRPAAAGAGAAAGDQRKRRELDQFPSMPINP